MHAYKRPQSIHKYFYVERRLRVASDRLQATQNTGCGGPGVPASSGPGGGVRTPWSTTSVTSPCPRPRPSAALLTSFYAVLRGHCILGPRSLRVNREILLGCPIPESTMRGCVIFQFHCSDSSRIDKGPRFWKNSDLKGRGP